MLPVVHPDGWSTVMEALFYAVLMIPVSLAPWKLGIASSAYVVPAVALGLVYLAYTIRFAGILRAKTEEESRMRARDLLKVSVLYLPLPFLRRRFVRATKLPLHWQQAFSVYLANLLLRKGSGKFPRAGRTRHDEIGTRGR